MRLSSKAKNNRNLSQKSESPEEALNRRTRELELFFETAKQKPATNPQWTAKNCPFVYNTGRGTTIEAHLQTDGKEALDDFLKTLVAPNGGVLGQVYQRPTVKRACRLFMSFAFDASNDQVYINKLDRLRALRGVRSSHKRVSLALKVARELQKDSENDAYANRIEAEGEEAVNKEADRLYKQQQMTLEMLRKAKGKSKFVEDEAGENNEKESEDEEMDQYLSESDRPKVESMELSQGSNDDDDDDPETKRVTQYAKFARELFEPYLKRKEGSDILLEERWDLYWTLCSKDKKRLFVYYHGVSMAHRAWQKIIEHMRSMPSFWENLKDFVDLEPLEKAMFPVPNARDMCIPDNMNWVTLSELLCVGPMKDSHFDVNFLNITKERKGRSEYFKGQREKEAERVKERNYKNRTEEAILWETTDWIDIPPLPTDLGAAAIETGDKEKNPAIVFRDRERDDVRSQVWGNRMMKTTERVSLWSREMLLTDPRLMNLQDMFVQDSDDSPELRQFLDKYFAHVPLRDEVYIKCHDGLHSYPILVSNHTSRVAGMFLFMTVIDIVMDEKTGKQKSKEKNVLDWYLRNPKHAVYTAVKCEPGKPTTYFGEDGHWYLNTAKPPAYWFERNKFRDPVTRTFPLLCCTPIIHRTPVEGEPNKLVKETVIGDLFAFYRDVLYGEKHQEELDTFHEHSMKRLTVPKWNEHQKNFPLPSPIKHKWSITWYQYHLTRFLEVDMPGDSERGLDDSNLMDRFNKLKKGIEMEGGITATCPPLLVFRVVIFHLFFILCNKDVLFMFAYMRFLANALFRPEQREALVPVIVGPPGIGKSSMMESWVTVVMGLGMTGLYFGGDVKRVASQFNSFMDGLSLVVVDETFMSEDKSVQAAMRSLVSESIKISEPKYGHATTVNSYVNFNLITNEAKHLPTETGDRRKYIVEACRELIENQDYSEYVIPILKEKRTMLIYAMFLHLHCDFLLGNKAEGIPPFINFKGLRPPYNETKRTTITTYLPSDVKQWYSWLGNKRMPGPDENDETCSRFVFETAYDTANIKNWANAPPDEFRSRIIWFEALFRSTDEHPFVIPADDPHSECKSYLSPDDRFLSKGAFGMAFPWLTHTWPTRIAKEWLHILVTDGWVKTSRGQRKVGASVSADVNSFLEIMTKFCTYKEDPDDPNTILLPCYAACRAQFEFYLQFGSVSDTATAITEPVTWVHLLLREKDLGGEKARFHDHCIHCARCSPLWVEFTRVRRTEKGLRSPWQMLHEAERNPIAPTERFRAWSEDERKRERTAHSQRGVPSFGEIDHIERSSDAALARVFPGCAGPASPERIRGMPNSDHSKRRKVAVLVQHVKANMSLILENGGSSTKLSPSDYKLLFDMLESLKPR